MRRKPKPDLSWPSWRYGPFGESAIFQRESDVPYGWTKKPQEDGFVHTQSVELNREDLIASLIERGITPLGNWSAAYMKELLDR